MSNKTPIRVTGSFTPSGTQDINITEVGGNPVTTTVPVSGTVTVVPSGTQNVSVVSPNPLPVSESNIDRNFGTWAYYSGINGTVVVTGGQRVVGISAYSATGGSFTINGGSTITLPAGTAISIEPNANLIAPTIIFTGTNTYFIEVVS